MEYEEVDYTNLSQDREHWWGSIKDGKLPVQLGE
jgi:hypothetical protein